MQVTAVATPGQAGWRWRIVNNAGEIVEQSRQQFPSIAAAIAQGTKRLAAMKTVDRTQRIWTRSVSKLRKRSEAQGA